MAYSVPMKVVSTWLTPEEKDALAAHAADRKLTLAAVLRDGLREYMRDAGIVADDAHVPEGQLVL